MDRQPFAKVAVESIRRESLADAISPVTPLSLVGKNIACIYRSGLNGPFEIAIIRLQIGSHLRLRLVREGKQMVLARSNVTPDAVLISKVQ